MSKQGGRGDRHMGTKRSHNKHRAGGLRASKGLTRRQRALKLHAISNRGPQVVAVKKAEAKAS
jgi:hypothetical protein